MQHSWNSLSRHPGLSRVWMVGRGWKGLHGYRGRRIEEGVKQRKRGRWIIATKWRDDSLKRWINLWLSVSLSQCGVQGVGCLPPPLPGSHLFLHMPWPSAAWLSSALYGLLSTPMGSRHAEDYRKCLAAELHRPASHLLLLRSPIVPLTWF